MEEELLRLGHRKAEHKIMVQMSVNEATNIKTVLESRSSSFLNFPLAVTSTQTVDVEKSLVKRHLKILELFHCTLKRFHI